MCVVLINLFGTHVWIKHSFWPSFSYLSFSLPFSSYWSSVYPLCSHLLLGLFLSGCLFICLYVQSFIGSNFLSSNQIFASKQSFEQYSEISELRYGLYGSTWKWSVGKQTHRYSIKPNITLWSIQYAFGQWSASYPMHKLHTLSPSNVAFNPKCFYRSCSLCCVKAVLMACSVKSPIHTIAVRERITVLNSTIKFNRSHFIVLPKHWTK